MQHNDRHNFLKEESHDVVMMSDYWTKRLCHYGCYFITFKREEQILKRMDRMNGDTNYYA